MPHTLRPVSLHNFHLLFELSSEAKESTSGLSNIANCYKNPHSPWPSNLLPLLQAKDIAPLNSPHMAPLFVLSLSGHSLFTELHLFLCPTFMQSFPFTKSNFCLLYEI